MKRKYPKGRVDPAPICDCHGESMQWTTEASRSDGGRWRCRIVQNAGELRRYHNGGKEKRNKEADRAASVRYMHSSKGRLRYGRRIAAARTARAEELRASLLPH